MQISNLERQIETRLRDNDVRYTRGRRRIALSLHSADGPRSAADLYSEIGDDVPLSSIYRSLAVLEDAGVVAPHYSTKGITRYELAEWLAGHHHHLVCVHCGLVEDIEIDDEVEARLEGVVATISSGVSFSATDHALEIEGRCSKCQ